MGFLHTYNITKTLAAFPCAQPNPIIIALTAVPAIAPALFEWAGFGCRDVLKFRMGRGAPCGRAMKGQVAGAIPPAFRGLAGTLLKWEHHFSYAGQMFLLADLISDTVARWTTLAYQLEGCPDALDGAAWQVRYQTAGRLEAGHPTPIGGEVVNLKGRGGIAWPEGAVVPSDWYFSADWQCTAVDFYDRTPAGLTLWIRRTSPFVYDYPAQRFGGGYPFVQFNPHYFLPEQHNDTHGPAQYTYMAMSDRTALIDSFSATCQATPFPQADWALNPLSCFSSLASERIPDPAGRNPRSRQPTMADRFLGTALPKPVRGPPGGKPRSKR